MVGPINNEYAWIKENACDQISGCRYRLYTVDEVATKPLGVISLYADQAAHLGERFKDVHEIALVRKVSFSSAKNVDLFSK